MKISTQWLSDYVQLPKTEELARRLTFAGLEIEGVHAQGQGLEGVVVAQILESLPHPNADKLSVTQVDAGSKGKLQIVCGAKNYKVGDKVPLATVGTSLPNGMSIKQAQLRGIDSSGMLCSAKELGLDEDASGLLILSPDLAVGIPIVQALHLDDVVLEVNATPNRPDALSHIGVAREVAVLTGSALKLPSSQVKEGGGEVASKIKIRVEDADRCPRYAARVVEGVKIGPSPAWLAQRLKACGVRSINNVVDVTNFILLEYGQPLHGFDLDKLAGEEIVVRTAKAGEKLTTLDGKERTLDREDLLICDRNAPQAIAGVMGGGPSEVSPTTTRVLIESAYFQPATVRRSSKRHALHTEASHRFERGTDREDVLAALDRAAQMIAEVLGGGTVLRGVVDVQPKKATAKTVRLRFQRVDQLLGLAIPKERTAQILSSLGFTATGQDTSGATYQVPSWRVDVDREEDLIEEVARIHGYDAIPVELPKGSSSLLPETAQSEVERRIRVALAGAGFDEVVNYSFVAPKWLEAFEQTQFIALKNPLSVEQSVMRTTLAPGLAQNAAHALRHQVAGARLYELGSTYAPNPKGGHLGAPVAIERLVLAGVLAGQRTARTWTSKDAQADFFDARGAVEAVLDAIGIQGATFERATKPGLHPRATAQVKSAGGTILGHLGELHPRVVKRLDLPVTPFVFELDFEALIQAAQLVPRFKHLAKFPSVFRDLAVVVPLETRNEEVKRVILEIGAPLVQDAQIFDVYTGKPLPEGKKNLAYALEYSSAERTLKDDEVVLAHAKIVEEVNKRLGASLRA